MTASPAAARRAVRRLPRRRLGHFPTALEPAPRLSAELGVRLQIKREDQSGLLLGGNKVRKLEHLLASPEARAASVLMTTGGGQSNHCREVAAAGAVLGKEVLLFLRGDEPDAPPVGNGRLFALLGAHVRHVGAVGYPEIDAMMADEAERLSREGRKALAIPVGGATILGVAAWAHGVLEAVDQVEANGSVWDHVIVSAGSGSTALGIALGLAAAGHDIPVWGVSASWDEAALDAEAERLLSPTAELLGLPAAAGRARSLLRWRIDQIGPGYTKPTPAAVAAVRLLARAGGILGDLTYTGKAVAGLRALVEESLIPEGANVLYVHTGGGPDLVARPFDALC